MKIKYYEGEDIAVISLREPGPDTVGEIAGEGLVNSETRERVPGIVLHRDDDGELYDIEIYSGASKRVDLDNLIFERVPPAELSAGTGIGAHAHPDGDHANDKDDS
ncbi:MAG: DUF2283 domain-containing protein [Actinomycetota bacterium]|nr:DUF2283 domain-containing protein [Actinomycetota bacterium]